MFALNYEILINISSMKIYFAGSIRGGRNDVNLYKNIIKHISSHGTVLTEHVGNEDLSTKGEEDNFDKFIFDRDMSWLIAADIVIAEVSTPSLGVGYELGMSHKLNKPVLCLYKKQKESRLSAMINGDGALFNTKFVI